MALDMSDEKNIYMVLVASYGKSLWHGEEYAHLKRRKD
jgi:hypothetical protein